MNTDAEFDPLAPRHIRIFFGHAPLNFNGAPDRIDHASELSKSTVSGILDDASVIFNDFGIEKRSSKRLQFGQRPFFVDPHQAARTGDIRRQNSRQPPLYVLPTQDAPPACGN